MQHDQVWQAVLGEIEVSLSRGNFITWFKNSCLLKHDSERTVIGCTNIFMKQTLEKKYDELIKQTLQKNGLQVTAIEYKIMPGKPAPAAVQSAPAAGTEQRTSLSAPTSAQAAQIVALAPAPVPANSLTHSYRQGLNERYTFDTFVVGASNELAFAACQAIAQQPGSRYNPLYLYGGVGIGKTHLIQAAGNALAARTPGKVLYISTEQFVQEFVDALRLRKTTEFTRHYRTAEVLIVDDIQFIAGKEKVQEEFFHTFNALHQGNKQIIICSDRPPSEIPTLADRLKSRLSGGMSIDMQIPDFETRCAIVQTKAQNHGSQLSQEVVEYLASHVQTNIRELEGALNQLLAWCEMRNLEPTVGIASGMIQVGRARPKHLSAKQIIERTARHFQVPLEDIVGPKRDKDIVVPRQIAMYMLREELNLSFPKIARELGRKDHTTAIHSVEKIAKECRVDASLRLAITEIKEHLYA